MLAKRKMSLSELSERVDITLANLSILKTGKAKAIRFSTLEAICKEFGIPKTKVRTPAALEKLAKDNGFVIKYNNAQA